MNRTHTHTFHIISRQNVLCVCMRMSSYPKNRSPLSLLQPSRPIIATTKPNPTKPTTHPLPAVALRRFVRSLGSVVAMHETMIMRSTHCVRACVRVCVLVCVEKHVRTCSRTESCIIHTHSHTRSSIVRFLLRDIDVCCAGHHSEYEHIRCRSIRDNRQIGFNHKIG